MAARHANAGADVPQRSHPYLLSPRDRGYFIEDHWPTVFFGDEVVAEIERKIRECAWARQAVADLETEARAVIGTPPQLPMATAGWRHDFYSRTTAEHLLYDPGRSDGFVDPWTGETEGDAAQRRAWVLLTHERTYRMMRSLGILYRVTGEAAYARWVADGMRQAAAYYTHREFRRRDAGGEAHYFSNLYDAAMLLLLANSYSLTRNSGLYTVDDHARIRAQIFEDRMSSQVGFLERQPTHNMACFVSAALAYSGQLFGQPTWVGLGLGEASGLRTQLERGLPADETGQADGFWYEGTTFYHFYSLCPLVTLWELDRNRGGSLTQDPELRRRFAAMFAAPVALVDRQLRLPLVGDLGAPRTMDLSGYLNLYEYAAGQVDPPRFGPILAAMYARSGIPRASLSALAFGPDTLPPPGGIPDTSTVLPAAGLGIFRTSGPEQIHLTFRCGRYREGHDHPDRLTVGLSAFGELLAPDLGTPGYSLHPLTHHYFRTTLAHNTLFADEKNQAGSANLEWRGGTGEVPSARGTVATGGITFRRTVFVDAPLIVLLDEYESDTEHRFGWVFHAYGPVRIDEAETAVVPAEAAPVLPPLPEAAHFALFTDRRRVPAKDRISAQWQCTPTVRLALHTCSDGPFEATAGITPGQPLPDRLGTLLLRAPGRKRGFATVFEASAEAPPTVAELALDQDGVIVTRTDGRRRSYRWQ